MFVLTVLVVSALMFVVYQLASSPVEPESEELKEQVAFLGKELAVLSGRYKLSQACRNQRYTDRTGRLRRGTHHNGLGPGIPVYIDPDAEYPQGVRHQWTSTY